MLATPAMAQTPQTGTIPESDDIYSGARIRVNPTVKWNATPGVWQVDYSVNVDLDFARDFIGGNFAPAAVTELNANIAKYERAGGPWYQMRYASTHGSSTTDCAVEKPAAYNSELIGGTGWYRSIWAAPGEKTCLTVWMYGENVFTPKHKGSPYNNGPLPMGVAYFVAPAAPSP